MQRSPGCDEACWTHAEKLLYGAKGLCLSKFEIYPPWKKVKVGRWKWVLWKGDICQFSEVYDLDRNDELWVMSQVWLYCKHFSLRHFTFDATNPNFFDATWHSIARTCQEAILLVVLIQVVASLCRKEKPVSEALPKAYSGKNSCVPV